MPIPRKNGLLPPDYSDFQDYQDLGQIGQAFSGIPDFRQIYGLAFP